MWKNSSGLGVQLPHCLGKVEGGFHDLLDPPGRGEAVPDVPSRHPSGPLDHPRVEAVHLGAVQVVVGHQGEQPDP